MGHATIGDGFVDYLGCFSRAWPSKKCLAFSSSLCFVEHLEGAECEAFLRCRDCNGSFKEASS